MYARVTASILSELERGVAPWRRPWNRAYGLPESAVTRRPYRGINLLLLSLASYDDPRWLTYRQTLSLGGHVRRGERSTEVVFWKPSEEFSDDGETKKRPPLLRTYQVFNVRQCEGLSLPEVPDDRSRRFSERIPRAETVLRHMPSPPRVQEGERSAWYVPADDAIGVPDIHSFVSADAYYATLWHELGHSTGHPSRLNRTGISTVARFGTAEYSREELVAEFCSAFLCAAVGLDGSLVENSAAYVGGWLKALREDPRAAVVAAGQAQRAADWILGKVPLQI